MYTGLNERCHSLGSSASRLLFLVLVFLLLTLALGNRPVRAEFLPPGAVPEQCANGDMNQFSDCRVGGNHGWRNSQVNPNNGQYFEGQFIPYRQVLDGLEVGNQYCFGFAWDITQGGLPAIDYLATFNETLTNVDPTYGTIHDGDLATPTDTIPIPTDPVPATSYWQNPTNVFTGTMPVNREITLWGGTFDSIGPYSNPGSNDISLAENEENSLEYCITATDVVAVLAFSGHIAVPAEWGAPERPTGSPYHMANGTKGGLFTAPRASETDLACVDPLGNITHNNIGRRETQLQVSETPTAITFLEVSVGTAGANSLPWVTAFVALAGMTYFVVARRRAARLRD